MKIETIRFEDLDINFSNKEMQGNGMAGNGIEHATSISMEKLLFANMREMQGNGIV